MSVITSHPVASALIIFIACSLIAVWAWLASAKYADRNLDKIVNRGDDE